MAIYCYAELVDQKGRPVENARIETRSNRLRISLGQNDPSTVQLKYAISYVSHEQARRCLCLCNA